MSALNFSSAYSSSLVAKLDTTRGLAPNFEPAICLQGQMRMGSVSDHQSSGHNYAPILGQGITHPRQRPYPKLPATDRGYTRRMLPVGFCEMLPQACA